MSVDAFTDLDGKGRQKVVAIDLDGTLAHYDHWRGPEHIGVPVTEAIAICHLLHKAGVKVIVYTCRTNKTMNEISGINTAKMVADIEKWLHYWGLGYIQLNTDDGKPFAHAYIDDRAVYFKRNGGELVETISDLERMLGVDL